MGTWNAFSITLYPGKSTRIGYGWNDTSGGPSFAEPREFTGSTRGNYLKVTSYATVRGSDNKIWYYVDVYNEGPQVAVFELMGGF